jgi:XRE family aerobic/anaerobic benzoate catabolism transcriptional regulator
LDLSRRELAARSGVSPRYLAQLEGGSGNISIGLLQKVAVALGQPIGWFVAAVDGSERGQRLCLIGLRGAGKSTLGRLIGSKFGVPFVELNREIEALGGMAIGEIMSLYGADGYRRLESEALEKVASEHQRMVLAVAGGIVADGATYDRLLARFHTVWVKASPRDHMERVRAQGDTRPMAGNPQAMAQLQAILSEREMAYGKAQAILDTAGRSVEQSAADLSALIEARGWL